MTEETEEITMEDIARTIFVIIRIEEDHMSPEVPMNIAETHPGKR